MNYADLMHQIQSAHDAYAASTTDEGKRQAVQFRKDAIERYEAAQRSRPPSPPPGPPPPPPPPPGPVLPKFTGMTAPDKNIKEAPSDIIQFDEDSIDIALLQDLLYEDIAATELANISRTDLIDGQSVIYSPIKNLSSVRQEFNPNNVIATSIATNYFSRFGIDIDVRGINEPYVDENGNLVIEVDTVGEGEEIQVQILLNGTISVVDES